MNSLTRRSELQPGRLADRPLVATPRVPASADQRRKVDGVGCVVCGRRPVDPAHLVPQRLGGCGHRDCVIGLCRTHHRLFDTRRLRLAPFLGRAFRRERAHALTHVDTEELQQALDGRGWRPPWEERPTEGENDEQGK